MLFLAENANLNGSFRFLGAYRPTAQVELAMVSLESYSAKFGIICAGIFLLTRTVEALR
jgi:hypothetical protein